MEKEEWRGRAADRSVGKAAQQASAMPRSGECRPAWQAACCADPDPGCKHATCWHQYRWRGMVSKDARGLGAHEEGQKEKGSGVPHLLDVLVHHRVPIRSGRRQLGSAAPTPGKKGAASPQQYCADLAEKNS